MLRGLFRQPALALFCTLPFMCLGVAPLLAQKTRLPAATSSAGQNETGRGSNMNNGDNERQGGASTGAGTPETGMAEGPGPGPAPSGPGIATRNNRTGATGSANPTSHRSKMNNGDNERQGGASTGAGTPDTGLATGPGAGDRSPGAGAANGIGQAGGANSTSRGSNMNNGDNERQGGVSTGAGTPVTGMAIGPGVGGEQRK